MDQNLLLHGVLRRLTAETFTTVKVTIRAYFKYANGYTFENEEDSYEEIEQ